MWLTSLIAEYLNDYDHGLSPHALSAKVVPPVATALVALNVEAGYAGYAHYNALLELIWGQSEDGAGYWAYMDMNGSTR